MSSIIVKFQEWAPGCSEEELVTLGPTKRFMEEVTSELSCEYMEGVRKQRITSQVHKAEARVMQVETGAHRMWPGYEARALLAWEMVRP